MAAVVAGVALVFLTTQAPTVAPVAMESNGPPRMVRAVAVAVAEPVEPVELLAPVETAEFMAVEEEEAQLIVTLIPSVEVVRVVKASSSLPTAAGRRYFLHRVPAGLCLPAGHLTTPSKLLAVAVAARRGAIPAAPAVEVAVVPIQE
jgi:hypothetical protein